VVNLILLKIIHPSHLADHTRYKITFHSIELIPCRFIYLLQMYLFFKDFYEPYTKISIYDYYIQIILSMHIQEAQKIVDQWIRTVGIRYYGELTNLAILTEEVGEVARLIARIYGEQSFKKNEDAEQAQAQLADEMADVLFVLICLANQTGIDLTEALQKNLDKKTRRDALRHANNPKLKPGEH
jgi:NTP pyrophosphatase (non-canonical NTP hydrolase)